MGCPSRDCRDAVLDHVYEAPRDVAALAFRLEDHAAAMRRTGIGAEHAEEIRKARHRQAEIGGRIIICPDIPQVLAAAPRDIETRRHFGHLEAGRDDNHIREPQLAVGRNDAIASETVDGIGDQFDIRLGQRFEPAIIQQDALAVGRVGRHAFLDQVGPVFQLGQNEVRQFLAMPVIAFVHGAIGMRPCGVLA